MKRHAHTLSVSLLILTASLAVCAGAFARQTQKSDAKAAQAEVAPLKSDASLAETLSWLDENLTRYGKFTVYQPLYEPGYRVRTSFLGLEAQGCVVTYRVKGEILRGGGGGNVIQEPNSDVIRGPSGEVIRTANGDAARSRNNWKPASAGGPNVDVRTLDLAAIDPSLVKGNTPKKWDGGSVLFGAGRGKVAVSYKDGNGKLMQFDGGEFYVSEKEHVAPIADALRRAVALCRK